MVPFSWESAKEIVMQKGGEGGREGSPLDADEQGLRPPAAAIWDLPASR